MYTDLASVYIDFKYESTQAVLVSRRFSHPRLRTQAEDSVFPRKGESERHKLLTTAELAELLGVAVYTLTSWRSRYGSARRGPSYIKVERAVRYRVADVEAYLKRQTMQTRAGK